MKNPSHPLPLPLRKDFLSAHRQQAFLIAGLLLLASWILGLWWVWERPAALTIYGNVDIREVNLGFRVPGRIAEMLKDEGDSVREGEIIARLDSEPYRDVLAEMTANVAVGQATLTNAEIVLKRNQELLPSHSTSQQEVDNALATRDQAAANLDLARARQASAQVNLNDTEIHAPAGGTIITRAEEPGAIVAAGTTVLTLSLDKPVWVRAYIAEGQLGRVHPGQEVELFSDTNPDHPFHGKVGYVSPRAEFTPKAVETPDLRTSLVYRLRIVVSDPDPSLRQGMPMTVKIPAR